jgi:hypothetical protein
MMTEYLQGAKIKPSPRLATALVYGIKNDTAGFQRPSLEEDVKAFKFLFPKATLSVMRKIEFSEMRVKDLEHLREALDRRVLRKHCMFAHMGEIKSPDNLVQIADFFLKVDIVDSSAVSGHLSRTSSSSSCATRPPATTRARSPRAPSARWARPAATRPWPGPRSIDGGLCKKELSDWDDKDHRQLRDAPGAEPPRARTRNRTAASPLSFQASPIEI